MCHSSPASVCSFTQTNMVLYAYWAFSLSFFSSCAALPSCHIPEPPKELCFVLFFPAGFERMAALATLNSKRGCPPAGRRKEEPSARACTGASWRGFVDSLRNWCLFLRARRALCSAHGLLLQLSASLLPPSLPTTIQFLHGSLCLWTDNMLVECCDGTLFVIYQLCCCMPHTFPLPKQPLFTLLPSILWLHFCARHFWALACMLAGLPTICCVVVCQTIPSSAYFLPLTKVILSLYVEGRKDRKDCATRDIPFVSYVYAAIFSSTVGYFIFHLTWTCEHSQRIFITACALCPWTRRMKANRTRIRTGQEQEGRWDTRHGGGGQGTGWFSLAWAKPQWRGILLWMVACLCAMQHTLWDQPVPSQATFLPHRLPPPLASINMPGLIIVLCGTGLPHRTTPSLASFLPPSLIPILTVYKHCMHSHACPICIFPATLPTPLPMPRLWW